MGVRVGALVGALGAAEGHSVGAEVGSTAAVGLVVGTELGTELGEGVGGGQLALPHDSVNVPDLLLLYASTMKYARCVLPWLFVHACWLVSGSSVHATRVAPGQLPPHRVSCLLSKLLLVWLIVKVLPGGTSA